MDSQESEIDQTEPKGEAVSMLTTSEVVESTADLVSGTRSRSLTEKGRHYQYDQLKATFRNLKRLSDKLIEMVSNKRSVQSIQGKYSDWMNHYEEFLRMHDDYVTRLDIEYRDIYLDNYEDWDTFLRNFRSSVQNYFSAVYEQSQQKQETDTYKQSVKNSKTSAKSSRISSLSAKRLKEEQQKAELEAKLNAFQKKKQIEIAKLSLKLEEEELQLNTDLAVASAKANVIDKFEQLELERSDEGSIQRSTVLDKVRVSPVPEVTSNLNPQADAFVANNYSRSTINSIANEFHCSDQHIINDGSEGTNITNCSVKDGSVSSRLQIPSYAANPNLDCQNNDVPAKKKTEAFSASETMQSVVQHLRKPVSEIKKFGGNPLEYRTFLRQFHMKVVMNTDNDDEKMCYLEQFTIGEANRVVQGFSHLKGEPAYAAALKQLEDRYGDNEVIASAFIKKALEWPDIKGGDSKSLDEFSLFLVECENAAESINAGNVLEYSENIRRLMEKLPYYLHDRWRNIVYKTKQEGKRAKFADFVQFVKRESKKANDPTYGNVAISASQKAKEPLRKSQPFKNKATSNVIVKDKPKNEPAEKGTGNNNTGSTSEVITNAQGLKCLYCDVGSHSLSNCRKILSLNLKQRYDYLRNKGLCFGCLKNGHIAKDCRNRATCLVCNKRHPTLLHDESRANTDGASKGDNSTTVTDETQTALCNNCPPGISGEIGAGDISSAMAIIPVKVKVKNKPYAVETYAFFDSGSSVTFCTEDIMRQLGCSGKKLQLTLNTMGITQKINTYALNGLQVCDLSMEHTVNLPKVYTKDELPVSTHHIPKASELSQWPHLSDIRLPVLDANIGLMIGSNVPDAYTPFEIITGPSGSPHATRTRLGWIVWNVVRSSSFEHSHDVNRVEMNSIKNRIEDDVTLDNLVRKSINYDFPERQIDDKRENSVEDQNFLKHVNETIYKNNSHYCIALPFRDRNIVLPNNESQGLQRLRSLKKRLDQNPEFKEDYTLFMNKLFDKGYAEEVPVEELNRNDGKVWYIPHHGIYHPKKPDKIRIVFDCSATYMGISLNNELLQGPDLTSNLLGVLLRFREEKVAVQGDIETMFYQVKVPLADRDCLRFFWWPDGNLNQEPVAYRMTVHLFGATSSPSCCNFALKRTIQDNIEKYSPSVMRSVERDMYVDDYLSSAPSDNEAITLVEQVAALCREGGFRLTKWVSNSPKVLDSIPSDERAKDIQEYDLEPDQQVERALGVCWLIEKDQLGFRIKVGDRPATRRGILAIVSSVYDPIGIVSPFVLNAKSILQRLCKLELGWDEEIPSPELRKWNNWLDQVSDLESVTVDRCYKPSDFGNVVSCQLHAFSDASDIGLGMVFYLRFVDDDGRIHCSFVLGKSRVAPLKTVTIPRLELTAATRAVRLCKVITEELNGRVDNTFYWIDSMSVLRYISNRHTRFHTFVANRLAVIHEATSVDQWNYVNTKLNPADYASRGIPIAKLDESSQWLKGPDFLWKPESEWPKTNEDISISDSDVEVKRDVHTVSLPLTGAYEAMDKLLMYFSSWRKLKRITAWLLTAMDNLKSIVERKRNLIGQAQFSEPDKCKPKQIVQQSLGKERQNRLSAAQKRLQTTYLSNEMLDKAEKSLVRYTQRQNFEKDFVAIQNGNKSSKKASKLYKLDPFIDCEGLLRVGGRLERADLTYDAKHPLVLPKDSQVSKLIIDDIHRSVGHLGKNAILSVLRQKYWMLGATVAIKSIVSKCVTCRKYQGPCSEQKMANLPAERLIPDEPPFTRIGMDYFGPFEIKRGRSMVKRYGVIFTCMATRAVHLEVSHSLDTDSCIDAIRRFISRRGVPKFIRSDNGTNLVGAEREMRAELQKWNSGKIHEYMLQNSIQWEFNPPSASHFGGVWERLIRSVRKVLCSVMHEQNVRLDDEGLHTLFCEVEAILNGRPLTDMSDNINDLKVLTPSHLLLLRPGEYFPPGIFSRTDNYVRRRWRQIQYLADTFWSRWTKEYLPLLQSRQKWVKRVDNIKTGDLVLVADSSPRNMWNLGRVVEVMTDKHDIVRIVKVKTASSVLTRPISKLCLILESDIDQVKS